MMHQTMDGRLLVHRALHSVTRFLNEAPELDLAAGIGSRIVTDPELCLSGVGRPGHLMAKSNRSGMIPVGADPDRLLQSAVDGANFE